MSKKSKIGLSQIDIAPAIVDSAEVLKEYIPVDVEVVVPKTVMERYDIQLEMHKSVCLTGCYEIENTGGGDVIINDTTILYVGDKVDISGDIKLYTHSYPLIRVTRFA